MKLRKKIIILMFLAALFLAVSPNTDAANNGKVEYTEYKNSLKDINISFQNASAVRSFNISNWLKTTYVQGNNYERNFSCYKEYNAACLEGSLKAATGTSSSSQEYHFIIDITADKINNEVLDEFVFQHNNGYVSNIAYSIGKETSKEESSTLGFSVDEEIGHFNATQSFDWSWGYMVSSAESIDRNFVVEASLPTHTYQSQLTGEYHHYLLITATLTYNCEAIYVKKGCNDVFDRYETSYTLKTDNVKEYWDYTEVNADFATILN